MATIKRIKQHFATSIDINTLAQQQLPSVIEQAGNMLLQCLLGDHKILSCGNGGSACNAQHFSSTLINRFETDRPALPSIALNADTSVITAIANDATYHDIFAKQLYALGNPGDVLLVFSTSGNARNILSAIDAAHAKGMSIIALTGKDGGQLTERLQEQDLEVRVPSTISTKIQETHLLIIHCLCDIIDLNLFGNGE